MTSDTHIAPGGKKSVRLDEDAVGRDARLGGLRGVRANLADLPAEEARRRHADLVAIEEGFRVPGHDLAVRPVFHWAEPRVHARVAICFPAFALLRILIRRVRVRKAGVGPIPSS